jgi:hypothetical protein
MKVTLELPDDLIRRVRVRAMQSNQTLKHTIAQLLEEGLTVTCPGVPNARAPKPMRLKGCGPLTINDIEAAIAAGRNSDLPQPPQR